MLHRSSLIGLLLLANCRLATAQVPLPSARYDSVTAFTRKIKVLTQQTASLKNQVRLLTADNQRQATLITNLQGTVLLRNDSLTRQQATIGTLRNQVAQLTTNYQTAQANLTEQTANLKEANARIAQLEYDKKNLVDRSIVRIYNFSADDVRRQFIQSLSTPESGFQYDDGLINDEIKITRNFDNQAEAWWVFDKTLDTVLELIIRIKPHRYDAQKAIVFGQARILQKTRFSNKPFEEQRDREKIALYSEKTLRLIEGKLSGTSDK